MGSPRLALAVLVVVAVASVSAASPPVAGPAVTDGTGALSSGERSNAGQPVARSVVSHPNTTGHLTLPRTGTRRSAFANASLDIGSTVAIDTHRFGDRLHGLAAFRAYTSAPNLTAKTAVLEAAAAEIENRTTTLSQAHALAIERHTSGSLSSTALLRRLVSLEAEARSLETETAVLLQRIRRTSGYSLPGDVETRLESLQSVPNMLQSPVRNALGRAYTGERDRASAYVATTADGIVVARIAGNRYVREAYLGSAHGGTGPDQFRSGDQAPISAAYDRVEELYPWLFEHDISGSASGFGSTAIYRIGIDHTQGQLTAYIDGTTREIFRELQEKRLEDVPITGTYTAVNETAGLALGVNVTHETGPMQVSVRDPVANGTRDVRIAVDGQYVGNTGSDGQLWTIQPSDPATVTATAPDGETVAVDGAA